MAGDAGGGIVLKNVTKTYGDRVVLDHINLEISSCSYVSFVGVSGAGKSTLMNILGTLDLDYQGEYFYNGKPINSGDMNSFRNRHIGFLFQQFNLLPELTVRENILLPCIYSDLGKMEFRNVKKRLDTLLSRFGIEKIADQRAACISGGEKQRAAFVRSIILDPDILICDEPTGSLDQENAHEMRRFLREMQDEKKTVIVVTHDREFAKEADFRYEIEKGRLVYAT